MSDRTCPDCSRSKPAAWPICLVCAMDATQVAPPAPSGQAMRYTLKATDGSTLTIVGPDIGWREGVMICGVEYSDPFDLPAGHSFGVMP